jgi:hypothetical protein
LSDSRPKKGKTEFRKTDILKKKVQKGHKGKQRVKNDEA